MEKLSLKDNAEEPVVTMAVIDDIQTVVDGISERDEWTDIGIQMVGTAFNGEEGLRLITEKKPDIIVTDIRMPKLGGIEMAEQVLSVLPNCKIIFISGYGDFDLAQAAIRMGAFDYVLKPFSPKQIVEVVGKARATLIEQCKERQRTLELEKKVKESMPLLRQEYLSLLVRYPSAPSTVKRRWNFLEIEMRDRNLVLFAVEIDRGQDSNSDWAVSEIELQRFAVHNILEETITSRTKGIVFRDGIHRLICLANADSPEASLQVAEACLGNVETFSRYTISIGISTIVPDLLELPFAYQQAVTALSYQFHTGGNRLFYYDDIASLHTGIEIHYPIELEKELLYAIHSGNSAKTEEVLGNIFAEWDFGEKWPSPEKSKRMYNELVLSCKRSIGELEDENSRRYIESRIADLDQNAGNVSQMRQIVLDIILYYCGIYHHQQLADAQSVINESIAYIRDHLHLNESVADYARQVHLSASYYANLFKKVTASSVMQFVVNEKIEKAKMLLTGGKSLQEVASSVGYEEKSYFSDVFKKKTGMTPTEFRQRYASS